MVQVIVKMISIVYHTKHSTQNYKQVVLNNKKYNFV